VVLDRRRRRPRRPGRQQMPRRGPAFVPPGPVASAL